MASAGRGGSFFPFGVSRQALTPTLLFEQGGVALQDAAEAWYYGADAPAGITGTATAALTLGVDATGTVPRTGVAVAAVVLAVDAAGTVSGGGGSAMTTAADGNWSDTATWTGGVVPGDGDTVIYNHHLTVDVPVTVGHSPGNSDAVRALACGTANKTLTVNAPLTIRGDFSEKGNTTKTITVLVEGNGAGIEFDSSASASPSTTKYRWIRQDGNNMYTVAHFNGTSANPVYLRSNSGGGNAYLTRAGFSVGGWLRASYCDFTRIGDGTNALFDYYLGNNSGAEVDLSNCICDACGVLTSSTAVVSGGTISLVNCTFKNGAHASKSTVLPPFTNSGTKVVDDCVFGQQVDFGQGAWNVTDNLFLEGYVATAGTKWGTSSGNFVRRTTQPALNVYGDCTNEWWDKAGTIANAHHFVYGVTSSLTIDGCVFATEDANAVGDATQPGAPGSARTYTVRNCILLPDETSGAQSGKLQGAGGNANVTIVNEHNTYISTAAGETGSGYGETYNGYDGIVSIKSCLAWSPSSGEASIGIRQAGSVQQSDPTTWDYNAVWNPRTGSDGAGYNSISAGTIFSSGSPGANDVAISGDPFVDRARNLPSWDAALGGAGTRANAIAELAKRNDRSGYNADYTIADLVSWVKAGFAVTDASLYNAGHDGATIGAGVYVDSSNDGAATVTLSLGVAAAGSVAVEGSADVGLALAVTATGSVTVQGSATAGLSLAATASGTVPRTGTATTALPLAATATGSLAAVGRTGAATVAIAVAVSATGTVPRTGAAAAVLTLVATATATSQLPRTGHATAPVVLTITGAGIVGTSSPSLLRVRLTAANGTAFAVTARTGRTFTFTPRA